MVSFRSLTYSALCLAGLAWAKSSTGDRVLVVLEPKLSKEDFSLFFGGLEAQGYDLTFRSTKDNAPVAIEDDVPSFDHVVLFAPETKTLPKDLFPQELITLLSHDTNLLIALSPKQTSLSLLASEFSLILPPPGTPLVSHFPERKGPATIIPVDVPKTHTFISSDISPVWFSGVPHALGNNPLLLPILNAPPESFATDSIDDAGAASAVDAAEKGGEGLWAGSALGLVTGFQTREGSRVVWAGGVDIFSDAFAKKDISKGVNSGNQQFVREVSAWAFREEHVIRIEDIVHHRVGETSPAEHYTTNDEVVYTAYVSKFHAASNTWELYSGIGDFQLEFTMLDPHIRTALLPVPGIPGKYSVTFRVPDRHGVFKFVVDHKRPGWSQLFSSTTVPVVPPRHDGYPRFLSAAWPYYAGAISTSVGFILFSAIWLAGDARDPKKGKGLKFE